MTKLLCSVALASLIMTSGYLYNSRILIAFRVFNFPAFNLWSKYSSSFLIFSLKWCISFSFFFFSYHNILLLWAAAIWNYLFDFLISFIVTYIPIIKRIFDIMPRTGPVSNRKLLTSNWLRFIISKIAPASIIICAILILFML